MTTPFLTSNKIPKTAWNNQVYDGTTYNMDWEYDALKAAHRTAALIKNPVGKPMNINLDTLVVPRGYANHHRAVEILGAFRKGWQPATSDREGPGVADYKIIPTPWITTNTGYWWIKIKMFTLNLFLSMGKTLQRATLRKLELVM